MIRAAYSLQSRLAWLVLGFLVVTWVGTAAITWFARHEVEKILDSHLAQVAALAVAQQGGSGNDLQIDVLASHRNAILWAVLRSTLGSLFAALPLLVLAVWWAVHRGLRPMRRLGRSLLERRPDVLDRVQFDDAPSEVVPMIDAPNALSGASSSCWNPSGASPAMPPTNWHAHRGDPSACAGRDERGG